MMHLNNEVERKEKTESEEAVGESGKSHKHGWQGLKERGLFAKGGCSSKAVQGPLRLVMSMAPTPWVRFETTCAVFEVKARTRASATLTEQLSFIQDFFFLFLITVFCRRLL